MRKFDLYISFQFDSHSIVSTFIIFLCLWVGPIEGSPISAPPPHSPDQSSSSYSGLQEDGGDAAITVQPL
jgi:hypothetical protein